VQACPGQALGIICNSHVAHARDFSEEQWGRYVKAAKSLCSSKGKCSNSAAAAARKSTFDSTTSPRLNERLPYIITAALKKLKVDTSIIVPIILASTQLNTIDRCWEAKRETVAGVLPDHVELQDKIVVALTKLPRPVGGLIFQASNLSPEEWEKLKVRLGERWPVCSGGLVSAASDSSMTDPLWEQFKCHLGAKWDTCSGSVVSAVSFFLIENKAAEFKEFKARLGTDWQKAGASIASSARKLQENDWKKLLAELKQEANKKRPFNIAEVGNGRALKAKKKLAIASNEGADEDDQDETPE
jgi:hypothetical protein